MKIAQQTLPNLWAASDTGTHVPLPLDASLLDDYALEEAAQAYIDERSAQTGQPTGPANIWAKAAMRAAIAAFAQSLSQEREG